MDKLRRELVFSRWLLVALALALVCGGQTFARNNSQSLIDGASSVLASLGKDPSRFVPQVVTRDLNALYLDSPGKTRPPETILFVPKSPADYPVWISSIEWRRAEWWVDEKGFGAYQSRAIQAAAARAFPGMAQPYDPDRYKLRVFETPGCLVFVFWPKIEAPKQNQPGERIVFTGPDTIVTLSSRDLTAESACDSKVRLIDQWDP